MNPTILRLIYLWAFVESGLGGFMHLFHLPITGFTVGGFSIIINILLAFYSKSNAKNMLTALGWVLLVKFTLSPQSPPGAYLAVGFQGALAILIFKTSSINRWSILSYSILVMLENAIQRPILIYCIVGQDILQLIIKQAELFFGNFTFIKSSIFFISIIYIAIHLIWGIIMAYWTWDIIQRLNYYKLPENFNTINEYFAESKSISLTKKILLVFIIIIILFWFIYIIQFPIISLGRIVLLILFFSFILPYILTKILSFYTNKHIDSLKTIMQKFPKIKQNLLSSYIYTKKYNGLKRWKEYLILSLYLTVIHSDNEH